MRLLKLIVTSVFCLCLLSGCGGENVKTDPSRVQFGSGKIIGSGTQRSIGKIGTPSRD